MSLIEKIESILEGPLEYRGYSIVQIKIDAQKRKKLQIMIDRVDQTPITINDCSMASRCASLILDNENLIKESYVLEMSSPGIDRPLSKSKDFKRFVGKRIFFKALNLSDKKEKIIGVLESADDKGITVLLDENSSVNEKNNLVTFSYSDICSAKLYSTTTV